MIQKTRSYLLTGVLCWLLSLVIIPSQAAASLSFQEEEVIFYNGKMRFSGTLFLPSSATPLPAIVMAHGSGEEHRKLPGYRSIAIQFAEQGFVCLLFDKRGVGDSEGTYEETPTYIVAAGDLIAAVQLIRARPEVDAERIGLFGHSQAGWIMPLAAAACQDIAFMVVSCGGGVIPRDQVIYSHFQVRMAEAGREQETIDSVIYYVRKYYTYLARGEDYEEMQAFYENAQEREWFRLLGKTFIAKAPPEPAALSHPGYDFFRKIDYDPSATLRALDIPVLVLLAAHDQQVPSLQTRIAWKAAYQSPERNELLTLIWLDDEGHALFERHEGAPRMRPGFAQPIFEWLKAYQ